MDLSPFVSSDPAIRRDGWSPERKLRFLDRLAGCGNVRAACAAVGMSRDAAYTLRRRDALFARGWATALVLARESSAEVLADKATEGIEEEVWYRGEMVGTRRRFDARLLLAHIARLDRMVEEAEDGAEDGARFDTILACIAGAEVPEELQAADGRLPLDRESALAEAEREARIAVNQAWADREAEDDDDERTFDERHEAFDDELETEAARACVEVGAQWDAWFGHACETVDAMLARREAPPQAAPAAGIIGADAAPSSSRTVSDVSGSATCATSIGPDGERYAHA